MRKMKSTLASALLTLVIAVPSLAGNIGTPGGTPPPPPPPPIAIENVGSPGSQAPENAGSPEPISSALVKILIALLSLI